MVYSTCSLNPIEDEAVVAELLRRFPGPCVFTFLFTVLRPGVASPVSALCFCMFCFYLCVCVDVSNLVLVLALCIFLCVGVSVFMCLSVFVCE